MKLSIHAKNSHVASLHGHISKIQTRKSELSRLI